MEIEFICDCCNKQFKNETTLKVHIATAKKCMSKRDIVKDTHQCCLCLKKLCSKQSLTNHLNTCSIKYAVLLKNENNELNNVLQNKTIEFNNILQNKTIEFKNESDILKKEIEKLRQDLKDICIKAVETPKTNTTINNNNKYTNLVSLCLPANIIKEKIDNNFTLEDFLEGQSGVASFVFEQFLKDENGISRYKCTDVSRGHFVFKNKFGDIEKDPRAYKLIEMFYEPLRLKAGRVSQEEIEKDPTWYKSYDKYSPINDDILEINRNNAKFTQKLATLTT